MPVSTCLAAGKRGLSTVSLHMEEDLKPVNLSDFVEPVHSHQGHVHDDVSVECDEAESHKTEDAKSRRVEKVLWAVAFLSAIFIATEFIGGYMAQSLAIMSDASHMISDFISFLISIFAIRFARRPASRRLSFGYHRAEVLGAFTSVIILWVLTIILVIVSIQRIIKKDLNVDANIMLITAGIGVFFNVIMGLVLHFGARGHGHSHGGKNFNVRAAFIHIMGDLVKSIGVLIAAMIIKFTGYTLADPICTFIFSIIVLFTTITVIRDIFFVLMEATPKHFDLKTLEKGLTALDGVKEVRDMHCWSVGMDKPAFSVKLVLESSNHIEKVMIESRSLVVQQIGATFLAIEIEVKGSSNKCH